VRIARHLVTNAEWLEFIEAGGYTTPSLWLSDGWAAVQAQGWQAPGYWRQDDSKRWQVMTLAGLKPLDLAAPVLHVSYYEAEAFARFAGKHLPSEAEWEVAQRAGLLADAFEAGLGNGHEAPICPIRATARPKWRSASTTASSWSSRWCLRGSSLATPEGHARVSYPVISFIPQARWQFSGFAAGRICIARLRWN